MNPLADEATPCSVHRLLVLGSMDEFVELVDRARLRGHVVFVADGYSDGPAKSHADGAYDVDVRNTEAVSALIKELNVDGIVTSFSDVLFESACKAAHAAGLYAYCPLDGMECLRDKRLMGKMFDQLGIAHPRRCVAHRDTVYTDCAGLTFPCVVKPVDGYGSYGISVAQNVEQVAAALDRAGNVSTSPDSALVEEYDDGPELNIIGWVADGTAHVVSIADREKCPLVAGGVPDVVRIVYPSRFAQEAEEPIRKALQGIADYTGIHDGPISMQVFWHPEDGTFSACEAAGRVLGYEHELTQIGAGFSIEDALLDLAYDRASLNDRLNAHSLSNFEGVSFVLNFHAKPGHDGRIGDLSVARALLNRPEALPSSMIHYHEGEPIGHGKGAKPYLARIFCHTATRADADALTAELFETFSVTDEHGAEVCCSERLPFMAPTNEG